MERLNKNQLFVDSFSVLLLCTILFYGGSLHESFDILTSPLDTTKLLACVVCSRCMLTVYTNRESPKRLTLTTPLIGIILITLASAFFHFITVIFGAPFFETISETYHFACLLTATSFIPCCITLGLDSERWFRVLAKNSQENDSEVIVRRSAMCSLLGAWLGAFPIPLDWDRPWQVWPISCVSGATIGYCVGLALAHVDLYIQQGNRRKTKLG